MVAWRKVKMTSCCGGGASPVQLAQGINVLVNQGESLEKGSLIFQKLLTSSIAKSSYFVTG